MKNELITVVIPVYKVEKYLKRCVDSVMHQTYNKLQIILVDDGSPDKCGIMCDEYKSIDNRVTVIHQKNKGLSGARNAAIEKAKGEYITFIDGDDWIEEDMIESLYNLLLSNTADIAVTSLRQAFENGTFINNTSLKENVVMNKEQSFACYLFNDYLTPCVCGKLYKTALWDDVRCPEGYLHEDQFTTYKIIDKAEKIVFSPFGKYFYFKRNDSIGHSNFSNETYRLYEGIQEQYEYISKKYPKVKSSIKVGKITWELVFINMMLRSNETNKDIILNTSVFIRKNILDVFLCKYIGIKRKIQICLFSLNFALYKKMYLRYKEKHRLG